jgi:hypothetical protein
MLLDQAMGAGAPAPDPTMEGAGVDPVSGNPVPPGGTPEGVRDDVPANLSEGEFVLPAHIVRFIGVNTLMTLMQKVEEQIKMTAEGGGMGVPAEEMDEELPFGPEELEVEDDMEMGGGPAPVNFNQGGLVQDPKGRVANIQMPEMAAPSVKIYKDRNGFLRVVPIVDGVPLGMVDASMEEMQQLTPKTPPAPQTQTEGGYQAPSDNLVNIDNMSAQEARSGLSSQSSGLSRGAMRGLSAAVPGMAVANMVQPALSQAYAGRVSQLEYGTPAVGLLGSVLGGTMLGNMLGFQDQVKGLTQRDQERDRSTPSVSPAGSFDRSLGATPALERGMTTTPSLALDTSLSAAMQAQDRNVGPGTGVGPAAPSPGDFGLSDASDPFGDEGKGSLW